MTHRGLTLIEVLVAVVLLGLIAATCVPLMQRARHDLAAAPAPPAWDIAELQALLLRIAEEPPRYGVEVWPPVRTTINWPNGLRSPITLRRAHATAGHVWIEAACGGRRVFAWAARTNEREATP